MMLQAPRFFYSEVVPSGCSAEGRGVDDVTEGQECDCVGERGRSGGDDDDGDHTTCYYESSVSGNVGESPMWLAYVVLCELAMRVLPCLLLVALNFLMVRDFNVSMRRRKKLKAAVFTVSRSSIFERVDPAVRGMTVTKEEEEEETKVPRRKTKKLRFMESIKRSVSGRFGGGGKENAAKEEPSVDLVDLVLQHQEQRQQQRRRQQLPPVEIRVQLAGQDEDEDDEEDLGVDSIRRVRSVRHPSERTMNTMLEEEEEEDGSGGTNTGGGSSSAATTAVVADVFGGGATTGNVVLVEGSGEAEVAPPAAVLAAHR